MDVSGSMRGGGKIELMRDTNIYLVEQLVGLDRPHKFGSVKFSTWASEYTPLEMLQTANTKTIVDKIKVLPAAGRTNLFEAIRQGFLQQSNDPDTKRYVRVVFVFTDGEATEGKTKDSEILAEVENLRRQHPDISIYTFGYGSNLQYDLLKNIADSADGTFSVISEADEMPKAFGAALARLLTEVASSVKFTFSSKTSNAQIKSVRSGYNSAVSTDDVVIDVGSMSENVRYSFIIKLILDNTCTAEDPLSVLGEATDPATGNTNKIDTDTSILDRDPDTQTVRDELTDVGAENLRYDIVEKYDDATIEYVSDRYDNCVKKLEEMEKFINDSGYLGRQEWINAALDDTITIRRIIEATGRTDQIRNRARLNGIRDAIGKQRTGSTDTSFKSVDLVTTPAQKKMMYQAVFEVKGTRPSLPFALDSIFYVSESRTEGDEKFIDVLCQITAPDIGNTTSPLMLTTVLDTTSAMDDISIEQLIKTEKRLIDYLGKQAGVDISLGIISFGQTIEELQPLTKIGEIDDATLKPKIDALKADGSAKLDEALARGVEQQKGVYSCAGSQVVFLITNSKTSTDTEAVVAALKTQLSTLKDPIHVYTFAFPQSDADLLRQIAEVAEGASYIMSDSFDISYAIGDAVGGLLNEVAKDIKVELVPADTNVKITEVFPKGNAQMNYITLPNLFSSEYYEFMVFTRLPKDSTPDDLLRVSINYHTSSLCGEANSSPIEVKSAENSPDWMNVRLMERIVATKLFQAMEDCEAETDLTKASQLVDKSVQIVSGYDAVFIYRYQMIADLAFVLGALKSVVEGKTARGIACSMIGGLEDLIESQRSKVVAHRVFEIEQYFDVPYRRDARLAMSDGIAPQDICFRRLPLDKTYKYAIHDSEAHRIEFMARKLQGTFDASDVSSLTGLYSVNRRHNSAPGSRGKKEDVLEERSKLISVTSEALDHAAAALAGNDFKAAAIEILKALQTVGESQYQDDPLIFAYGLLLTSRFDRIAYASNAGCDDGYVLLPSFLGKRSLPEVPVT